MSVLLIAMALAALWFAARWPAAPAILAAPALLICVYGGLTLPDIDQPLPLDHRSALTHGIAPALFACIPRWARVAAAGLALGLGLHLAADIFPDGMVGYATVAVPFSGRLGAQGSYLWLVANALACAGMGVWLLVRTIAQLVPRAIAALGTALIGLSYLPRVDGGWAALGAILLAAWLVMRRRLPPAPVRATGRS